ncbi:MAG: putative signal transducing protein [Thermaurantimonas sp.]|uniref:putative signal transducing protein n=1 Tax=Thermaurantimonas sp. TaxID=2681568 RepID=UPI003918F58F
MEVKGIENQWMHLASVGSHSEALVICSKLESAGIKTYIKDQYVNTLLGPGVSGFKIDIYVLLQDYEKALDIYYDEVS